MILVKNKQDIILFIFDLFLSKFSQLAASFQCLNNISVYSTIQISRALDFFNPR